LAVVLTSSTQSPVADFKGGAQVSTGIGSAGCMPEWAGSVTSPTQQTPTTTFVTHWPP